jgi:hypothetical protein
MFIESIAMVVVVVVATTGSDLRTRLNNVHVVEKSYLTYKSRVKRKNECLSLRILHSLY